jgi:ATP-dependent Clp protease ATP-binding subunit ClpA
MRDLADRPDAQTNELRSACTRALLDWGFAPELLNRMDRIFVFRPLRGIDIARVGALEIEAIVQGYGLEVHASGIDPEILYDVVRRQEKSGSEASSRDVIRSIEERMADSLIEAKRRGAQFIKLVQEEGRIVAIPVTRRPISEIAPAARRAMPLDDAPASRGRSVR